jgi:hypothetical protein
VCSHHDIQIFLWLKKKTTIFTVIHDMLSHIHITSYSDNENLKTSWNFNQVVLFQLISEAGFVHYNIMFGD